MLFYKKGLREFLAACGVRGSSCDTPPCGGVSHEQGGVSHEVVLQLVEFMGPRHGLLVLMDWRSMRPWELFYKKCLREFLGACRVRGTSANTVAQDAVFAEGGVEGPHRFVFDLETISQHEKAAGRPKRLSGHPRRLSGRPR